jgi:hypothetical protein
VQDQLLPHRLVEVPLPLAAEVAVEREARQEDSQAGQHQGARYLQEAPRCRGGREARLRVRVGEPCGDSVAARSEGGS